MYCFFQQNLIKIGANNNFMIHQRKYVNSKAVNLTEAETENAVVCNFERWMDISVQLYQFVMTGQKMPPRHFISQKITIQSAKDLFPDKCDPTNIFW